MCCRQRGRQRWHRQHWSVYTRGGGAGCEATSLRRSGRIRRPIPSSTSTPATTPPSSISRLERRQGRGEVPPGRAAVRWLRAVRFFRLIVVPHVGSIGCIHNSITQRSRARRLSIAYRTCATTSRPPAGGNAPMVRAGVFSCGSPFGLRCPACTRSARCRRAPVVVIGTSGGILTPNYLASYAVQRGVGISMTRP